MAVDSLLSDWPIELRFQSSTQKLTEKITPH